MRPVTGHKNPRLLSKGAWAKRLYCSNTCKGIGMKFQGASNPNWRGGKTKCLDCNKELAQRYSFRDTKYCHSCAVKGERSVNWRGGITPLRTALWHSVAYQVWRNSVFERDGFRCVMCGDEKGGNLQADHIYPFAMFPQHRFDTDNGRTLCVPCHTQTSTYGYKTRKLMKLYGV